MPRKAHFSDHDFVVVKHVQVNSAAQALQFNGAFDASAAKLVIADLPAKVVALLQPFLDSKNTSILILTPILMPLVNAAGIDPIYFGVLFVINNSIGLITPPVGVVLNVVAGVTRTSMKDVMKGVWPFLVSELFVLRQPLARRDRLCQWHNSAVPFSAIRILGIDPGLNRTGYGVVEVNGSRLAFIAAGVIRVPAGDLHQRLGTILRSLAAVIRDTQPHVATVEKVFVNVNPQSTLLLGQARGAAICAAVGEGLVVHEYAALRIKQAVVGFGRADKRQVQTMVQRLLSLDRAPTSDAADALACAICHAHSASLLMALRSKASIAPRVRSTANGRRAWTARLQGLE